MSTNLPRVTVVVPVYNRRQWTLELLQTLEKQDYPRDRWELITVDNGSKDGTWEMLGEFAQHTALNFRFFRNPAPEKVPAASRNKGILESTGDIVAFTDSDCLISPQWLSQGVAAFSPGVGIVEGKTIPVPGDPNTVLGRTKTIDGGPSLFDTCNIFYSREALERTQGFSRDFYNWGYPRFYGEDLDLGYKVKELGFKVAYAEEALVMHHNQPQSFWKWLTEVRLVFICPYLAKRHPTARKDLLFLNYFLSPSTALFDVALFGAALALFVSPWWLALGAPYLCLKFVDSGREMPLGLRIVRALGGTVRSFATFLTLLSGSLRFGSLIL